MSDAELVRLIGQISSFSKAHASIATGSSRFEDEFSNDFTIVVMEEFVTDYLQIQLLPQLQGTEWVNFAEMISDTHSEAKERTEVHLRLQQILSAVGGHSAYDWLYEKTQTDDGQGFTIPDFALMLRGTSKKGISHLEATPQGKIMAGQQRSEGFFVANLLNEIELMGQFPPGATVEGLCAASDGYKLCLSKVSASLGRGLSIVRTEVGSDDDDDSDCDDEDHSCDLWTAKGVPSSEPPGLRILRSLMAADPSVWLRAGPPQSFTLTGGETVHSYEVLGRGAFCSVLACNLRGETVCVKRPLFTTTDRDRRIEQLIHLSREREVLRAFAQRTAASAVLPCLHPDSPPVSLEAPFVVFRPVGVSLCRLTDLAPQKERTRLVTDLVVHLCQALEAAHELGVCHSDIRPGNVILADGRFHLIDWGLSRAAGENLHPYRGNWHFFAAAVLRKMHSDGQDAAIPYLAAYDYESVKYVAYGFLKGAPHLPPRWKDASMRTLIEKRRKQLNATNVSVLRIEGL